jgi:hypothetical protein
MSLHDQSGPASYAACSRLFRRYPLAVRLHLAHDGYRSMVLMNRAGGPAGFFILTENRDGVFVIRSWNRRDGISQEIRPGGPVSGAIQQVITGGMPVPHDGALPGWLPFLASWTWPTGSGDPAAAPT